jgi:hypothetical protein
MTPLAQRFFGQLAKPLRDRAPDPDNISKMIDDLHCFDATAVYPAVYEAMRQVHDPLDPIVNNIAKRVFLPSNRTWIETCAEGKDRFAMLLQMEERSLHIFVITPDLHSSYIGWGRPNETGPGCEIHYRGRNSETANERSKDFVPKYYIAALLYLDIINTPGLVGLTTRQPHRGLARNLRRAGVGSYPLRAWHEITIKPGLPELTDEERSGQLTGRKCLHFVRSHRRHFQDGHDTIIPSHWRGDAALGMQRTRYIVGE